MSSKKNLAILGSTGSVGKKCLELIHNHAEKFNVVILMAGNQYELLGEQCNDLQVPIAVSKHSESFDYLRNLYQNLKVYGEGDINLRDLFIEQSIDLVINALPSIYGYKASLICAELGIQLALANKESLLIAGDKLMKLSRESQCTILPIDSEASAIFQCLQGEKTSQLKKIYLTASGGPFYKKETDLSEVKKEDALNHPVWSMGEKISVDSATMMNKVFEIHEISKLFDVKLENIEVLIHPQSKVHSMVKFKDGQIKALISGADMKYPIQYALHYPERIDDKEKETDLFTSDWHFKKIKEGEFPCFDIGLNHLKSGKSPISLLASNDFLVESFLRDEIKFSDIPYLLKRSLDSIENRSPSNAEEIDDFVKECQEISISMISSLIK